jgi:hypothetical protein
MVKETGSELYRKADFVINGLDIPDAAAAAVFIT